MDNPKCETCRWAGPVWIDEAFKHGDERAQHITCRRYPDSVTKHVTDFCGEHSELAVKTPSSFPVGDLLSGGILTCTTAGSAVGDAATIQGMGKSAECEHEWETQMKHVGYERTCRICKKFEFVNF